MHCRVILLNDQSSSITGMFFARLESSADAERSRFFNHISQAAFLAPDRGHGKIQHRHLHSAGDVHSDRIGDYGIAGSQHTANRQAISHVGIRHQAPAMETGRLQAFSICRIDSASMSLPHLR